MGEEVGVERQGTHYKVTSLGEGDGLALNIHGVAGKPPPLNPDQKTTQALVRWLQQHRNLVPFLQINAQLATRLWEEGTLILRHLTFAEETKDSVIVHLCLGDDPYRVTIIANLVGDRSAEFLASKGQPLFGAML